MVLLRYLALLAISGASSGAFEVDRCPFVVGVLSSRRVEAESALMAAWDLRRGNSTLAPSVALLNGSLPNITLRHAAANGSVGAAQRWGPLTRCDLQDGPAVSALVGGDSASAGASALASGVPLVSHLGMKNSDHPYLSVAFSAADVASAAPVLATALGWTEVAILYDEREEYSALLLYHALAASEGVAVKVYQGFAAGDEQSGLSVLKQDGVHVIFAAVRDLESLAETAGPMGMIGESGHVWVLFGAELNPEVVAAHARDAPGMRLLLEGLLQLFPSFDGQAAFHAALQGFDAEAAGKAIWVAGEAPTADRMEVDGVGLGPPGANAMLMYDAVVTLALAWGHARVSQPLQCPPSSEALSKALAELGRFEGASGTVSFVDRSGERSREDLLRVGVWNFVRTNSGGEGSLAVSDVGHWSPGEGLVLGHRDGPVWPGGSLGWERFSASKCLEGHFFDWETSSCIAECPFRIGILHDVDYSLQTFATLIMALRDVNRRDGTVVAAANEGGIAYNVSAQLHDESPLDLPAVSREIVTWASMGVKGVVGSSWSLISESISFLASASDLPLLSHWSTASSLSDAAKHPTFGRTVPTSSSISQALPNVLNDLSWRACVVVHRDDSMATSVVAEMQHAAAQVSVDVLAFEYQHGNLESIGDSVRLARASGRRVVIYVGGGGAELARFLDVGDVEGIVGVSGYALLIVNVLGWYGGAEATIQTLPAEQRQSARRLLQGAMSLTLTTQYNKSSGDAFDQQFARFSVEEANGDVQFGNFSITEQQLREPCSDVCRYAYDAVFAYALSWTKLRGEIGPQRCPSGQEILQNLRGLRFEGASGLVSFAANGDRGEEGVTVVIHNIQAVGGAGSELREVEMGIRQLQGGVKLWRGTMTPHWPGGASGWGDGIPIDGYCPEGKYFDEETLTCLALCPFRLGIIHDFGLGIPEGAALFMALRDVNLRSGSIVPAALGGGVSYDVTYWVHSENQFDIPGAVQSVSEWSQLDARGVVGPVRSVVSEPISLLASLYELPVVSHWSTSSSLSDAGTYPYFGRTIPTDAIRSRCVTHLMKALGIRACVAIYRNDAVGVGMVWELQKAVSIDGGALDVQTFDFEPGDRESLRVAVRGARGTGLRVIVFMGTDTHDMAGLLEFGDQEGILGRPGYLLIDIATVDNYNSIERLLSELPSEMRERGKQLLTGAVWFHVTSMYNASDWDAFEERYAGLKLDEVNGDPEFGTHLNMTEEQLRQPCSTSCRFGYDAVFSYALAFSKALNKNPQQCPKGSELLAELRGLRFEGASGLVTFAENGDRGDDGMTVVIFNEQPAERREGMTLNVEIGIFTSLEGVKTWESVPPVWPGGAWGWDAVPPDGFCPEGKLFDGEKGVCLASCDFTLGVIHRADEPHLTAAIVMALRDVNRADGSVVAAALEGGVIYNVSYLRHAEDPSDIQASVEAVVSWADSGVAGIVGPSYSSVSIPVGLVAGLRQVVTLSPLATASTLSDQESYPYFNRVIPSDLSLAHALPKLLMELGWRACVVVYRGDVWGKGLVSDFAQAAAALGIQISSFEFEVGDRVSMAKAVRSARASRLRVVVCVGLSDAEELGNFLELADSEGIVGRTGYSLVNVEALATFGGGEAAVQQLHPELRDLGRRVLLGALSLHVTTRYGKSGGDAFDRQYAGLRLDEIISDPVFGDLNMTEAQLRLECNDFCRYTYDAVFAYALAWTQARAKDPTQCPGVNVLLEELRGLHFEGASGLVTFDANGDRPEAVATVVVYNVQAVAGGLQDVDMGIFTIVGGMELWRETMTPHWPGGVVGWSDAVPIDGYCPEGFYFNDTVEACFAFCNLQLGIVHDFDYPPEGLAIYMALQDVNNQFGSVVPASLGLGLTDNVSYFVHNEKPSNEIGVLRSLTDWAAMGVAGVVGPSWASLAAPISALAGLYQLPVVSHWTASTSLSDDGQYPYFGRTIPTDLIRARMVPSLLSAFGWRACAVVYINNAMSQNLVLELQKVAANHVNSVDVLAVGFEPGNQDSMLTAVRAVQATGRRVIVYIGGFHFDLIDFVELAYAEGILGRPGYSFIDLRVSGNYGNTETVINQLPSGDRARFREKLVGSLYVHATTNYGVSRPDAFDHAYGGLVLRDILSDPEFGKNVDMTEEELRVPCSSYCRFAYDAVMAYWLAWTKARKKDLTRCPSGSELQEEVRRLHFEGASGHVSFAENGDRADLGTTVVFHNVRGLGRREGELPEVEIGIYRSVGGVTLWRDTTLPVWTGGFRGWDAVPPDGYCPEGQLFEDATVSCLASCDFVLGVIHREDRPERTAALVMALRDVNRRDGSVVPAGAPGGGVAYDVSYLRHAEDPRDVTGAAEAVTTWADMGVVGVLGPMHSSLSGPVSILAGLRDMPVLSPTSSSSFLSDNDMYPFFGRVVPTLSTAARVLPQVLHELGWMACVVVYRNDLFGSSIVADLEEAVKPLGLLTKSFPFEIGDRSSMHEAVRSARATKLRVVLYVGASDVEEFGSFLELANSEGIVGRANYTLIDMNTVISVGGGNAVVQQMPTRLHGLARRVLHGALTLSITTMYGASVNDAFDRQYATLRLEEINGDPVFGDLNMSEAELRQPATEDSRRAYDAVFAYALAYSKARERNKKLCPGGSVLLEELRGLRFEGASGLVSFAANGDRGEEGVTVVIHNIQAVGGAGSELREVEMGIRQLQGGVKLWRGTMTPRWPGGASGWGDGIPIDGYCPEGKYFDEETLTCLALCPFRLGIIHDFAFAQEGAALFMALRDVNLRSGSIVPAALGGGVSHNVTRVVHAESVDDATGAVPVVSDWATVGVAGVVGPKWSALAEPVSLVAGLYKMPVLSHWAASPSLSDPEAYSYFGRTIPTNLIQARALPTVVRELGWSACVVVYLSDNYGISLVRELQKGAALDTPVDVLTFGFKSRDRASMLDAVRAAKGSKRRIFVFIAVDIQDLSNFLELGDSEGIVGQPGYSLIDVTVFDSNGGAEATVSMLPAAIQNRSRQLLTGTVALYWTTRYNASGKDAFDERYAGLRLEEVNSAFDKHLKMTEEELRTPCSIFCRTAYDAVFAYALAWSSLRVKIDPRRCPLGTEVREEVRSLHFEGASGLVTFDENGDRGEEGVTVVFRNIQTAGDARRGGMQIVEVEIGTWRSGEGVRILYEAMPVWPGMISGWDARPKTCPEEDIFNKDSQRCVPACAGRLLSGRCIDLGLFVVGIVVPVLALLGVAMLIYVRVQLKKADSMWMLRQSELCFDGGRVIGQGTFGLVMLADLRGTQVAVKKVLPKKFKISSPKGTRNSTASGVGSVLFRRSVGTEDVEIEIGRSTGSPPSTPNTPNSNTALFNNFARTNRNMSPPNLHNPLHRSSSVGSNLSSQDGVGASMGTASVPTIWPTICGNKYVRNRRMVQDFIEEMRILSKLRHPCITTVIGAVLDAPEPMLVMEYMSYGSLRDLVHNDSVELEGEMLLTMFRDVVQGMRFLHGADPPIIHADIKGDNLLVDERFHVKVADFGLSMKRKLGLIGTPAYTAPELLRGETAPNKESDVYAFGMTLYEVYARGDPYVGEDMEEALMHVAFNEQVPYRPKIPDRCPETMGDMMKSAWAADPTCRPTFAELDKRFSTMDVETIQIKSMRDNNRRQKLLHEVFPPHIADALAEGKKIEPIKKDIVTIFFSDIVGFTTISSTLDPSGVSEMLHNLYTKFDALSREHECYKVETIGDAYMAVTNLVKDQETDHAARMARFARDAIKAANETLIDVNDESKGTIKIRVGLHSGSVVANVVGTMNPRFCLFGDTVNVSSRMESNSIEGLIHASHDCASKIRKQDPTIQCVSRGILDIKGKGKMETWWVLGADAGAEEMLVVLSHNSKGGAATNSKGGAATKHVPRKPNKHVNPAKEPPADWAGSRKQLFDKIRKKSLQVGLFSQSQAQLFDKVRKPSLHVDVDVSLRPPPKRKSSAAAASSQSPMTQIGMVSL